MKTIETTDQADEQALFKRIKEYLKVLDNGDYSGREIKHNTLIEANKKRGVNPHYNKMKTKQEQTINKFLRLSDSYHKLSILFHELGQSINIELKKKGINPNSLKQIKEYLKTLNLDFDKLEEFSKAIDNISYSDIKKEGGLK